MDYTCTCKFPHVVSKLHLRGILSVWMCKKRRKPKISKNEDVNVVAFTCFHRLQLRAFELLTFQYISTILGEAIWGRYVLRAEGFKFWTMKPASKIYEHVVFGHIFESALHPLRSHVFPCFHSHIFFPSDLAVAKCCVYVRPAVQKWSNATKPLSWKLLDCHHSLGIVREFLSNKNGG